MNTISNEQFFADPNGFYGEFGGRFVTPELDKILGSLASQYLDIIESDDFQREYITLLKDYVGRPSPLYKSVYLSELCGCKVYLKREDLNHTGAHKINNTIGQILLAKTLGKKKVIAETGAGQHGVATATVCAYFNMECDIFMGAEDVRRQYLNVQKMKLLGANVHSVTEGTATLCDAVNAALKTWCSDPNNYFYLLGSAVGPHPYPDMVARFQSVISKEIKSQLFEHEKVENPDYLVACVGGGSNAAGTFYHYLNNDSVKIVIAEAAGLGLDSGKTAATLSIGQKDVLHGSKTLVMKGKNGEFIDAYSISAGLDYPGVGPLHAALVSSGRAQVVTATDDEALTAALALNRYEGILPAIESAHTLAVLPKVGFEPNSIVVATLSGRGDKDIETYLKHANRLGFLD